MVDNLVERIPGSVMQSTCYATDEQAVKAVHTSVAIYKAYYQLSTVVEKKYHHESIIGIIQLI